MAIHYQESLDRIFHALGDGTRRTMLAMIAKRGECTASELGKPFRVAQPTISKHIRVLEQASLVSRRVAGRIHHFRLNTKPLTEATDWIARHRTFWENSLDALGNALDDLPDRCSN
ncbi:MAG: helix-turn-helix transcriptional regulator [Planctomycetales bacterium]|nr:helix-turn-helix transcriptional regulator [Planctomycetales bacterium]